MTWSNTISLKGVREDVRAAAARGLLKGVEHVLQVSNTKVPIEEATLERSGHTSIDEANLKAAVSYGTAYAVAQHEELGWEHKNGRSAKYLETSMNSERPMVTKIIGAEIRKALRT